MLVYKLFCEKALKCRLIYNNITHGPKSLSALFLFLQQLAPPRDITSMELCQHVLSKRFDGLSGNNLVSYDGLYYNLC